MEMKLLVDGGVMKPGPALSQKLGPAGVSINDVISKVNEATKSFKGMQVPVILNVNLGTKEFEIEVSSPPVSGLLKKEAGIEKGSGAQDKMKVANLSIEQIISVAKQKQGNLLCRNLKNSVKIVVGSCTSLGILVESKSSIEVGNEIDAGKYDKEIEGENTETPEEKKKELADYFKELKEEQDKKLKIETDAKETEEKAKEEKK